MWAAPAIIHGPNSRTCNNDIVGFGSEDTGFLGDISKLCYRQHLLIAWVPVRWCAVLTIDDQKIVGKRPVISAPLAVRPLNADACALGHSQPDMYEACMAGGVSAADTDGSVASTVT